MILRKELLQPELLTCHRANACSQFAVELCVFVFIYLSLSLQAVSICGSNVLISASVRQPYIDSSSSYWPFIRYPLSAWNKLTAKMGIHFLSSLHNTIELICHCSPHSIKNLTAASFSINILKWLHIIQHHVQPFKLEMSLVWTSPLAVPQCLG